MDTSSWINSMVEFSEKKVAEVVELFHIEKNVEEINSYFLENN